MPIQRGKMHGIILFSLLFLVSCSSVNYEEIGDNYAKSKNWEQAIKNFKLAAANDPNPRIQAKLEYSIKASVKSHFRKGTNFLQKEDFYNAINEFMEVLQLQPGNQIARDSLAEAKQGKKRKQYIIKLKEAQQLVANRELTKAKSVLTNALDIVSNNTEARDELRKVSDLIREANDYISQGKDYLRSQSWRESLDSFNAALRIWADNPEVQACVDEARNWIKHERHISDGKTYLNAGNLKRAHSEFVSARNIHRTHEVDSLLTSVGGKLYEPEYSTANSLFLEIKTKPMSLSERAVSLEKALSIFLRAQEYQDTREVKTCISEIKNILSREMSDSGVAALTLHNYEYAVDALSIANRNGAMVESKLNEAIYLKNLWAGYKAESNGRFQAAKENYSQARKHNRSGDIEIALKRVEKRGKTPQPLELARARDSGYGYESLESDIKQRAYISQIGKSTAISSDIIPVYSVGPELGKGIDISSLKLRNQIIDGEISEEETFESNTHFTEFSSLYRNVTRDTFGLDVGLSFKIIGIGANISRSIERVMQTSKYSFDIRYEVIVKKAEIESPTIRLKDDVRMDEWVRSFGTHYISEAWYGGQIIITCEKSVSDIQAGNRIAGKFGGNYKIIKADISGSHEVLQFARETGFKVTAKIRGGKGGVSINSIDDFIRYKDRFKKEVQSSHSPAIIKVKIRSYSDPSIKGFPFQRDQFANIIDRKHTAQSGDFITKMYSVKGNILLAQEKREKERQRREEERRRVAQAELRRKQLQDGLQKIADAFGGNIKVKQSFWKPINLTGYNLPASFNLASLTVITKSKIEFALVTKDVYRAFTSKGISVTRDSRHSVHNRNVIRNCAIFYLDTSRRDSGKFNINKRLTKGEYYLFIYNNNAILSASISLGSSIGP